MNQACSGTNRSQNRVKLCVGAAGGNIKTVLQIAMCRLHAGVKTFTVTMNVAVDLGNLEFKHRIFKNQIKSNCFF